MTKYYVTKYALTKGILELDGELAPSGTHISFMKTHTINSFYNIEDCHTDRETAILKAVWMRDKKMDSLRTQLGNLKKLRFE